VFDELVKVDAKAKGVSGTGVAKRLEEARNES